MVGGLGADSSCLVACTCTVSLVGLASVNSPARSMLRLLAVHLAGTQQCLCVADVLVWALFLAVGGAECGGLRELILVLEAGLVLMGHTAVEPWHTLC